MLVCKSSPASSFLGAWSSDDDMLSGEEVLLRTKFDLDAHEGRYEYLTETLAEGIAGGEFVNVSAEIGVPEQMGRYWGCFKVLREGEREFYCAFRYPSVYSRFGNGRIIVREENWVEEKRGIGRFQKEGMMMLEKMLEEQPSAPMTLWEMFHGHVSSPNLTSTNEVTLERFHLTAQKAPPRNNLTDGVR